MESTIILKATAELEDKRLREWVVTLDQKIQNINKRTKRQTLQIKDLQKEVKELKKKNE